MLIPNRCKEVGMPVLADGELCWTTDTKKLFVGDGTTNRQIGATGPAGPPASVGVTLPGATPFGILFVDAAGNLAQSPNFQFDSAGRLRVRGTEGNFAAQFISHSGVQIAALAGDGVYAGTFLNGAQELKLCDGVNVVGYAAASEADWNMTPPTSLEAASDRLAAKDGPVP